MVKKPIPINTGANGSVGSETISEPIGGASVGSTEPQGGTSEPQGTPDRIAGFSTVSPIDAIDGVDSSGAKRRGRPPGAKNRTGPTETKKTTDLTADLEGLILSFNLGIAAFLAAPEFESIDKEKNKAVADSIRNLAALYSRTLNPKTVAWMNFIMAAGSAYGPPIYFASKRGASARLQHPGPPVAVQDRPKAAPKQNAAAPDLQTASQEALRLANEAARQNMSPSQLWSEGG
jgi:hypothetical protein